MTGLPMLRPQKNITITESTNTIHRHRTWLLASVAIITGMVIGFAHAFASHKPQARPAHARTEIVNVQRPNMAQINADTSIKQKHGFINQIGYPAMKAFQHKQNYQVLPSIVIAQAIIESDWGQSQLCTEADNIFGTKGTYNNQSIVLPTEEDNGGKHIVNGRFRKYSSMEASILDHDSLLKNVFIGRNHEMSYQTEARLIKAHAYATDPNYAQKLINTIKNYHLYRYDKLGLK